MAEAIDVIIQRFEVDVGKALANLEAYAKAQRDTGASHDEVDRHVRRRVAGENDLERSLMKVVSSERQEGRAAKFLAGEVQALIGSKSALLTVSTNLAASFAGGMGIGLIIDLVQNAVFAYRSWTQETERREAAERAHAQAMIEARVAVQQRLDSISGATTRLSQYGQAMAAVEEAERKAFADPKNFDLGEANIKRVRDRLEEARKRLEDARTTEGSRDLLAARREVKSLEQELDGLQKRIGEIKAPRAATNAAGPGAFEQAERTAQLYAESEAKRVAITSQAQTLMQQAVGAGLDKRARAEAEYKATVEQIDKDVETARLAAQQKGADAMAALDASAASARASAKTILEGKITEIERDAEKDRQRLAAQRAREQAQEAARKEREALAQAKRVIDAQLESEAEALAATQRYHAGRSAVERHAYNLALVEQDDQAAGKLDSLYAEYQSQLDAVADNEERRNTLLAEYEAKRQEIINGAEDAHTAKVREEVEKRVALVLAEAQTVVGIFLPMWTRGWSNAATVNRRYQKEYEKISRERREIELVEQGIAGDTGEAKRIAAEEAAAAEAKRNAEEKQAIAERLNALALEFVVRAAGAAAGGRFWEAGAYAAAAGLAAAYARKLHGEAVDLQQGRGYTAEERNDLERMRGEGGTAVGGMSTATSEREIRTERVIVIPAIGMTQAEAAAYAVRALRIADRLDMRSRTASNGA